MLLYYLHTYRIKQEMYKIFLLHKKNVKTISQK